MSALIVYLPEAPHSASTEYRYAQTRDGQTVSTYGSALASTLPQAGVGQDLVAIVPVRNLSWHRLDLPKGTLNAGSARLRAVLDGLMEERVLDEPHTLHFAVAPPALAQLNRGAASNSAVWVAACDKAWLQGVLAPLEAAGRPVSRIVPEFAPLPETETPTETLLSALGDPEQAWLVQPHAGGVSTLPLQAASVSRWLAQADAAQPCTVLAEPAVVALASSLFPHPVSLQQAADRWVQALASPWDLAQFDLANSGRQRALKKFGGIGQDLLHAPRWRAVRWGVALAVVANLVGLNAWAWKEKTALAERRSQVQAILTQTFPQVKVVLDAPVQMGRELTLLRQATGAATRQDLENLLTALGNAQPPTGLALSKLDYSEGELRLQGAGLKDDTVQTLRNTLEAQGYALRMEGGTLSLSHPKRDGAMP